MTISEGPRTATGGRTYQFEDRKSREVYSFGEEEYFLCQSLDGVSTSGEVLGRFQDRFGVEMSREHFRDFQDHLLAMGLAERSNGLLESAPAGSAAEKPQKFYANPRWPLFDPSGVFRMLLAIFGPLRPVLLVLNWILVAAVPVVIFLMVRHAEQFRVEVRSMGIALGYLGGILFGLLAANFVRCLIQGVVCAYFHVAPQAFGIKLRRLIFPRFYIDKSQVRTLDRHGKLWIFGTSILVRLYFIAVGGMVWAIFKDSHSLLPSLGVVIAQSGFIGLFLQLIPFDITDGYRWVVNFFNLPPTMLFLATKVFLARIRGRALPSSLSGREGWIYLLYGAILIIGLPFGLYHLSSRMAEGFSDTFPNLFGRATSAVFFVLFLGILVVWFMRISRHSHGMADSEEGDRVEDFEDPVGSPEPRDQSAWGAVRRHKWLAAGVALAIILCLPAPYRPGGEIQILPPTQQQVQAPVSGKISKVFFEGGDGRLIVKGTVIAKMTSSEIENQILTLEQTKAQQEAALEKARSELAKLVAGARKEEIEAAEANLEKTEEQINIAGQELASAKVASAYSTMVLPRMKKLYDSGSIAYLQYEEAKKTADIEVINVQKAEKNLAALKKNRDESKSQLDLLRSGARGEDVDAARHTVEAAQAELARVNQQIVYFRGEDAKSALLMPFDGYLVDSHLHFKEGAYLSVGQIYATGQNNSQPQVEVQLPEYDMEGVEAGAVAKVKLFAYPGSPFEGKVTTIQPAALPGSEESKETITRLFRVLIKTDDPPVTLKAGMTGYAKINAGIKPLGVLLARPIIRFVQVEMWSWLP